MVKQQMHYLGSCSDKWPMYGCEQFLTKETLSQKEEQEWLKKATRLIFRIERDAFFPTYLAVGLLVNFHSWEHPQPSCFFICKNFPSLSCWGEWICTRLLFSLSSQLQVLHLFCLCIHFLLCESLQGQIVGLIHLWIHCELNGWQFNPSRSAQAAVNPPTNKEQTKRDN